MKKYISTILIIGVFIVGLLVMLYPSISNWYNEKMNSYVVSNYTGIINSINEEDYAEMLQEARDYNELLHSSSQVFVSGEAQDFQYIETLDVYNGMMGYIVIEEFDVKLSIMHGTDEGVLQTAVGHLEGSSLPTGDIGNHTVLTGHTGLPTAELFTCLSEMEIGDTFQLYILNEVITYEVFNIVVVEPEEVDDLETVEDKDLVTLVTCTPYGVNSHRLLVQGVQIDKTYQISEVTETNMVVVENSDTVLYVPTSVLIISLVSISSLLVILLILIIRHKYKKYQHKKYRYTKFKVGREIRRLE